VIGGGNPFFLFDRSGLLLLLEELSGIVEGEEEDNLEDVDKEEEDKKLEDIY